ncbi:MAG: selenoneine biosynthesis selenosugar synthase SenB [Gemmataceae bacterium]
MACPAPTGSRHGNRVTAERWARILRSLGHQLTISNKYSDSPCDLMVALHARKSYSAIARYRKRYPNGPLIVALTGTDLYGDIRTSKRAQKSLELADCLIVLQPCGKTELVAHLRKKVQVIYQSVEPVHRTPSTSDSWFDVCVLGHLREVKDPFRAALALPLLPNSSRVRVLQVGKAMNAKMARRVKALAKEQPRYRWYGEVSRIQARRILGGSRLLVLSSIMEGGANVLSEAIVAGVPVLASKIPGNIGLLGSRYPGYFPVGDTLALMKLLHRAETDASFYQKLKTSCNKRRNLFDPNREQRAWSQLLKNILSKP